MDVGTPSSRRLAGWPPDRILSWSGRAKSARSGAATRSDPDWSTVGRKILSVRVGEEVQEMYGGRYD